MTSKTGRPIPSYIGAIATLTWETFLSVVIRERLISIVPHPLLEKGRTSFYFNRDIDVYRRIITIRLTWNLVLGHRPC